MKHVLLLLTAIVAGLSAQAEPQTLTHGEFDISVDIETRQVVPGMPLYLYVDIKRHRAQRRKPMELRFEVNHWLEFLSIQNAQGEEVGKRPEEPWQPACSGFTIGRTLKPGESLRKTIIVHQWRSTDLAPGDYALSVSLDRTLFATKEPQRRTRPNLFKDFKGAFCFPITILPRNDEAVNGKFKTLLETATRPAEYPRDDTEKFRAFDTILYAQGPLAVPHQLALVQATHDEKGSLLYLENRLVELFRYLAHSGEVSTVQQLIALAEGPGLEEEKSRSASASMGVWWYLLWAIREMHETGDADTRALTSKFFEPTGVPDIRLSWGYYSDCWSFDDKY